MSDISVEIIDGTEISTQIIEPSSITAVVENAPDIIYTSIATQGIQGPAGTTSLQESYDVSTATRIITDSTKGAVKLRRGSGADTDSVLQVENGSGTVVASITGDGAVVLTKISGAGIKVDTTTPTFGWKDLFGIVLTDITGADAPDLSVFRGGSVRDYAYKANDKADLRFHIPHDYVAGSDIFLHVHWGHNGTAISGNIVMTFAFTYAKGHDQQIFPAEKTISMVYTTNIGVTPRYIHRLDEIQLSALSPTVNQLLSADLEPDGVILMNMTMTTIPTITGGSPNEPFVFFIDLHYQSTNITTKQKAPPFYV